jgi:hypothetical protein
LICIDQGSFLEFLAPGFIFALLMLVMIYC